MNWICVYFTVYTFVKFSDFSFQKFVVIAAVFCRRTWMFMNLLHTIRFIDSHNAGINLLHVEDLDIQQMPMSNKIGQLVWHLEGGVIGWIHPLVKAFLSEVSGYLEESSCGIYKCFSNYIHLFRCYFRYCTTCFVEMVRSWGLISIRYR